MKFSSTEAAGKLLKLLPPDDPLRLQREKEMKQAADRSERELQNQIRAYLRGQRGVRDDNWQPMHKRSNLRPGSPDFKFAFLGEPVAIEAKVGDNTLSEDQKIVKFDLEADGWTYCIARSVDDVKKCLDQIAMA